jgi:hypothetical protein
MISSLLMDEIERGKEDKPHPLPHSYYRTIVLDCHVGKI